MPAEKDSPEPQEQLYTEDDAEEAPQADTAAADSQEVGPVSWTASEFIDHEKKTDWYIKLGLGAVLVTGIVYLLTRDIISSAMMIVVAGFFGFLASRKPKPVSYNLNGDGVSIGEKTYPWSVFKSFAILEEGAVGSIYLTPLKKLQPPVGMYFNPAEEDKILQTLGHFLPQIEKAHDPIDKLMHRVRF